MVFQLLVLHFKFIQWFRALA
jgi:hypothetical protein